MNFERAVYIGFSDEMEKIALGAPGMGVLGRAAHHLKNYATTGWDTQGSRLWKGIGVGMTALQLPGVLKSEDPSGQGRSRFERGLSLAGDTAGGFIGAGVAAKHFPNSKWIAPIAAGTAGSMLGSKVISGPLASMRRVRLARQQQARDQMLPDEGWRAQSPVSSPPATEGRELL